MKKLLSIVFTSLFVLCGCTRKTDSSISESLSDSASSNSKAENKYVKGQRIYDIAYEPDGYIDETLSLEEFPDLSFVRSDNKHELYIEGRDKLISDSQKIGAKGIYLADINNDGYTDLAYYQDRRKACSLHHSNVCTFFPTFLRYSVTAFQRSYVLSFQRSIFPTIVSTFVRLTVQRNDDFHGQPKFQSLLL